MIRAFIQKYFSKSGSHPTPSGSEIDFNSGSTIANNMCEEEWERFQAPETEYSDKTEAFIQQVFETGEQQKKYIQVKRFTAAAAVFIILVTVYFFYSNQTDTNTNNNTSLASKTDLFRKLNTSNQNLQISLPDQSIVILSPGSEITYARYFDSTKREVFLTGEAVFKVYKDEQRPFTVYCKDVATVALGTVFRVSEKAQTGKIAVALLEGKIVVRSVRSAEAKKSYYLLPGNLISYNIKTREFIVSNSNTDNYNTELKHADMVESTVKKTDSTAGRKELKPILYSAEKRTTAVLQFKNEPLKDVLNKLAHTYHVEIAYPTEKVSTINFIGAIPKGRSVKKILSDIALMNNLELVVDSAGRKYEIR